ncbi:RagB/SusD family nutrient uptake outer membrane protein [Chitinophaga sancti]|uniref:RagB/SusD family nutrient uptake outer membrane protein n=1 Tax=Chitinophaga sancti TaxID=1004 RepID=A0A1K1QDM1_9BACT|nr:RagB/SusD family nutrient uptake outer membrane protein [Chitinophaga sancti]WQD61389.1 RagB/SusD family nutrient uptake outer membrane protein [Chitinophaga sancti]WQG93058.1 RagB/SusD family nutrient uptake outer membrane protein [Chitinophaga sancti]SFW57739.1 Starch-binding associating with outer membrane [Chitinophaga sancti]
MKRLLYTALLCCTLLCGCKKLFDIKPKEALDHSAVYQNVNDADAAVIGIYGKLMGLSARYMILNELRGDLVDVTTSTTDKYLQELNIHDVSTDNTYADPRPFYEVIMNCNDALKNFDAMLQDKRMSNDDYILRYSAVGAIRSWLYLQLGIHYGEIPYITDPLETIDAIKDAARFPRISFDELLDKLVTFTEGLPYKYPFPAGTSLLITTDGYSTEKFFINIKCLLGELYLWKGNYTQAALNYRVMMNYADVLYPAMNSEQWYEVYRIGYTANLSGALWSNIFSQPYGERYSNYEIIWNLPFDKNFAPSNPFIALCDNIRGSYQIRPSELAIANWNKQFRSDNTPVDQRGPNVSYKYSGTQPVIKKYTYNYNPLLPFETNSKWILFRAAALHLHYAEAANRDNRDKIAYALMNTGIKNTYDPVYMATGVTGGEGRNVTDIEQTKDVAPYDFDARDGNYPQFRNVWYRNIGVRGRMGLKSVKVDSTGVFDMSNPLLTDKPVINRPELINRMEDLIIDEDGLELAFEGYRWPDLLRIALRRQATDPAWLANKIAAKFIAAHDSRAEAVRSRLMNKANWYLPFKW